MTRVPIIGILAPRFPPSTVTGYRVDSFSAEETSRCCMRTETYETNVSFFRPWAHHFFFALIGYRMVRVFPHTALSWHKAPNELACRSWLSKTRPEYGRLSTFSSPPVVRSRAQAQLGSQVKTLAPAQSSSYWPRYVVREQSIIRSRFHTPVRLLFVKSFVGWVLLSIPGP
jgi:hypothetical protein